MAGPRVCCSPMTWHQGTRSTIVAKLAIGTGGNQGLEKALASSGCWTSAVSETELNHWRTRRQGALEGEILLQEDSQKMGRVECRVERMEPRCKASPSPESSPKRRFLL